MEPKIIEWRLDELDSSLTVTDIMDMIERSRGSHVSIVCPQQHSEADYRIGTTDLNRAVLRITNDCDSAIERRDVKIPALSAPPPQPMNRHQRRAQQKRDRTRR